MEKKIYRELIQESKKDGSPVVFINNKIYFLDKFYNAPLVPVTDEEWEITVKFERERWGVFIPIKRIENVEFDWERKLYILKSGWRELQELPTQKEEWVILENDRGGVLPRIHLTNAYKYNNEIHYDNEEFIDFDIDDDFNIILKDVDIKKISSRKFINEINDEENLFEALNRYVNDNKEKINNYIEYRKSKREKERKLKEIKEKINSEWHINKAIQLYKTLNQLTVEELERDSDYVRYRIVADGVEYEVTEGEDIGLEENIINYDEDVIYMYSLFYLALYRKPILNAMYENFDNIIKEISEEIKRNEKEIEIRSDEVKEYSFTPVHDRINENKNLEEDKERAKKETEERFEKMKIKLDENRVIEKEYKFGKVTIEKNIKRRIRRMWDRITRGKEVVYKASSPWRDYESYDVAMPSGSIFSQYVIKVIPEVETRYNVIFNNNVPQLVRNDILNYIEKEVNKK